MSDLSRSVIGHLAQGPDSHAVVVCPQGSDRISKITSDENLAESVHSQHFAGETETQLVSWWTDLSSVSHE